MTRLNKTLMLTVVERDIAVVVAAGTDERSTRTGCGKENRGAVVLL